MPMTSKSPVRSAEDIDEAALSYAEIKALATGNPLIKEKMDLDIEVARLKVLKSSYLSQKYALEDQITKLYPAKIADCEARIRGFQADIIQAAAQTAPNADGFSPMAFANEQEYRRQVRLALNGGQRIVAETPAQQERIRKAREQHSPAHMTLSMPIGLLVAGPVVEVIGVNT